MLTISNTSHQHHEAIQATIDRFPALADSIRVEPAAALTPGLKDAHAFLVGQLLPHMEMAEANLYPALEALLSDTKAMQPMRREHLEVRRLVDELGKTIDHLHDPISPGDMVALRRVLFRLFAIVKVHLGEEQLYLPALEHSLSPEAAASIVGTMKHASVFEL